MVEPPLFLCIDDFYPTAVSPFLPLNFFACSALVDGVCININTPLGQRFVVSENRKLDADPVTAAVTMYFDSQCVHAVGPSDVLPLEQVSSLPGNVGPLFF
jgi:hypothetical protein